MDMNGRIEESQMFEQIPEGQAKKRDHTFNNDVSRMPSAQKSNDFLTIVEESQNEVGSSVDNTSLNWKPRMQFGSKTGNKTRIPSM